MSGAAALTIVNAPPEIERAANWLDAFAMSTRLSPEVTEILQVVLDELLTNVIGHGLVDVPQGGGEILLRIARAEGGLVLEVIDDGPAFDPTARAPTDAAIRIARRQVGGIGLLMVHRLMDKVTYARDGSHNRLTLWKRLPS